MRARTPTSSRVRHGQSGDGPKNGRSSVCALETVCIRDAGISPTVAVPADKVPIFANQPTSDAVCMENAERVERKCVLVCLPFLESNGPREEGVG